MYPGIYSQQNPQPQRNYMQPGQSNCRGRQGYGQPPASNFQSSSLQQILSLLLPLLQQLLNQNPDTPTTPQQPLQEVRFDADAPQPLNHVNGVPVTSIEYRRDGYSATLADGTGVGVAIAAPGSDALFPRVNGVAVTRVDYNGDTATYTLENGSTLVGARPAIPVTQSPTPGTPTTPGMIQYDGDTLTVNGKSYTPQPVPAHWPEEQLYIVASDSASADSIKQILSQFPDVQITRELRRPQFDNSTLMIQVPESHLSQWQQALTDNLPDPDALFYNVPFVAS